MLSIGKLGKAAGVKVPTIRYYEEIGLMPPAERSAGNQRVYSPAMVDRLSFIRHARELGFALDAIRELLRLSDDPGHSCEAVDEIARRQLAQVQDRIARLQALSEELQRMLNHCAHGKISDCRVIKVLRDHTECCSEHGDTGL